MSKLLSEQFVNISIHSHLLFFFSHKMICVLTCAFSFATTITLTSAYLSVSVLQVKSCD